MTQLYRDESGKSGIYGYEVCEDFIDIYFKKGSQYKWTYDSAGQENVEEMKRLAQLGTGLNSFINNNCKDDYEE